MSSNNESSTTAPHAGTTPESNVAEPVMITVRLQVWDDNDNAIEVGQVDFDARPILAGKSADELMELRTNSEAGDALYFGAIDRGLIPGEHDGPFAVETWAIDEALNLDPHTFDRPYDQSRAVRHANAVLLTPLTPYEIGTRADDHKRVSGLFAVNLGDMIGITVDDANDLISNRLVGSSFLMDPTISPGRVDANGNLVVRFDGDASTVIDNFDDMDLEAYEAGRAASAEG